jgi:hypothetical protein
MKCSCIRSMDHIARVPTIDKSPLHLLNLKMKIHAAFWRLAAKHLPIAPMSASASMRTASVRGLAGPQVLCVPIRWYFHQLNRSPPETTVTLFVSSLRRIKGQQKIVPIAKPKRTMSASARRKIAAAQRLLMYCNSMPAVPGKFRRM